jgi:hypothetical protein
MKHRILIPLSAYFLFAATSCDKQPSEIEKKIAELERKNQSAEDRQRALEQQIEDQKIAAERDAIERERVKIEEERAAMARQQGQAAAEQNDAIRRREEGLAEREEKLGQKRAELQNKQDELVRKTQNFSDRDRDLAGREALPFQQIQQRRPVGDYGMFYDSLSSYGSWFESPDYGYVWQPVVVRDSGWRPYSRGRWACSDRGWTWVSEEPFGWATYHYGRWALLRGRGWVWVPGTEWAPSWVSWRQNDRHIGWAPLPPETLAYRGHSWGTNVDVQFRIGALSFNFVEIRNFGGPVYAHCLPVRGNTTIIQQTTNITYIHVQNQQVICGGPRYRDLSDRIGKPLPFYRLEVNQSARQTRNSEGMRARIMGDKLMIAAPNIDNGWNAGLKPKQVKGQVESGAIERDGPLTAEVTNLYRQSREESRQKADETVKELGGRQEFERRRLEVLQENRALGERELLVEKERSEKENAAANPSQSTEQVKPKPFLPDDSERTHGKEPSVDEKLGNEAPKDRPTPKEDNASPTSRPERPKSSDSTPPAVRDIPATQETQLPQGSSRPEMPRDTASRPPAEEPGQPQKGGGKPQAQPNDMKPHERPATETPPVNQAEEKSREAVSEKDAAKERMREMAEKQREATQASEEQKEQLKAQQEEQRKQAQEMQKKEQQSAVEESRAAQAAAMEQQKEQAQLGEKEQLQRQAAEEARAMQQEQADAKRQEMKQREAQEQEAEKAQAEAQQRKQEDMQQQKQQEAQQRQEEARQQQQEEAKQRQREEMQQRQAEARQQQQEEARQRQQEEMQQRQAEARQQQQEEARQRQQEEMQQRQAEARQQQQEQAQQRQQQESQRRQEKSPEQ